MSGARGSKKSIWDTRFGKPKKALAFDECLKLAGWAIDDWITVHPNGPDNLGRHVELDGEGRIINGMGGVHNGKKLSEIGIKSAFPKEYHGEETNPDNIDNPHFVDRVWGYNAEIKENERKAAEGAKQKITLTAASLPPAFTKTKAEAANTEKLLDFINSQEGVNPDVLELLNNAGEIINSTSKGEALVIQHGFEGGFFEYARSYHTLKFPKLDVDPPDGQAETTIHEIAHAIDYCSTGENYHASAASEELSKILAKPDYEISQEAKDLFKERKEEFRKAIDEAVKVHDKRREEILAAHDRKEISAAETKKMLKGESLRYRKESSAITKNVMGGVAGLEDIYDALQRGKALLTNDIICGHGRNYYRDQSSVSTEIFANFVAMSVVEPEAVEVLRRDKPELVAALERQVREMNEKVKARKAG